MKSSVVEILNTHVGHDWKTKKYIIAVSGGGDSMSILHFFTSEQCHIIAAHVNYGLRENDADLDEACVTQFCTENDIPLEIIHPDTKSYCEANKVPIQEGARLIRYEWFDQLLQTHDADYIITAHHQEDVIETFIINLQRGSGIKGLHPLPVVNGNKLRPLVTTSKQDILQYLTEHNAVYREDLSNAKNDYLRNSIRNLILPELYEKLPKIKSGIISTISNLRLDSDYLFEQLEKEKLIVFIATASGGTIARYRDQHKRLLFHIVTEFGFHFDQLEQLLDSKTSGKVFVSKTHQILINRTDLIVEKLKAKNPSISIEINDFGTYEFAQSKFIISTADNAEWDKSNVAFFPIDKLLFPFKIRNWRQGDAFIPFGMKGSKKVSDYLIDCKISSSHKQSVSVIEYQNEIAWLVAFRTSEKFKSDENTTRWISIEYLA
jgi:tRNA(Ile)-lysidine synthase